MPYQNGTGVVNASAGVAWGGGGSVSMRRKERKELVCQGAAYKKLWEKRKPLAANKGEIAEVHLLIKGAESGWLHSSNGRVVRGPLCKKESPTPRQGNTVRAVVIFIQKGE